jgi:UDP-N-acetylmuramoyl-tripeptide--D-alanyl-D-alanine ligase
LASPASFNNTGGLSRTMNEHLTPGTEVLIAEMGMYGPGEIRAMCDWVRPTVAAIVNIGPVHLERVGSLDGIVAAKREIFERAEICVLNVDAHGLAAVADEEQAAGKRVIRVSTMSPEADVTVVPDGDGFVASVSGQVISRVAHSNAPISNVAAAIGLALAVGLDAETIGPRLGDLPGSDHRQQITTGSSGATVIDNTFSSNPASAASTLSLLAKVGADAQGRRLVVTPGMVELGPVQDEENTTFAGRAGQEADVVVVIGRTNRGALLAGAQGQRAEVLTFDTRDQATVWIKAHAGPGDVIAYEGDLPDHYP